MVAPSLPDRWREDADVLQRRAATEQAEVLKGAAGELDEWLVEWWTEPLDLDQCQVESGYHHDSLLRFIREGKCANVGTEDDPRIRRCDLPCKPGHRRPLPWLEERKPEDIPAVANARPDRASSAQQAVRSAIGK